MNRHEPPPTAGLPFVLADFMSPRRALPDTLDALFGIGRAVATCSGTAALVLAMRTLRDLAPQRNTVVVPGYTCQLVVFAVLACGLRPRICDVAPDGMGFDLRALQASLDDDVLAVVPAHLGGRLCDMGGIHALCRVRGVAVIEDAAQALGARRGIHSVGTESTFAIFSLAVGKGLTTYEGGLLTSADAGLLAAAQARAAIDLPHDPARELVRILQLIGYGLFYRPRWLGLAYGAGVRRALRRSDTVGAAGDRFSLPVPLHSLGRWRQSVAASAAHRLPAFLHSARERAKARAARLRCIAGVDVADDRDGDAGTWPVLWVRLADAGWRDAALARLWPAGLGVAPMFERALPDYDELRALLAPCDVPNARRTAACTFTITNSAWLDDAAFESICRVIEAARVG